MNGIIVIRTTGEFKRQDARKNFSILIYLTVLQIELQGLTFRSC